MNNVIIVRFLKSCVQNSNVKISKLEELIVLCQLNTISNK